MRSKSLLSSKGNDNTLLIILIVIFATAIIIGSIIGSSYYNNEKFTSMNKLIYLYMDTCGHCKEFNIHWENIKSKIDSNKSKYKVITEKYNISDKGEGSKYADKYGISYAPAILFISSSNGEMKEFNGSRTVENVLNWIEKQN